MMKRKRKFKNKGKRLWWRIWWWKVENGVVLGKRTPVIDESVKLLQNFAKVGGKSWVWEKGADMYRGGYSCSIGRRVKVLLLIAVVQPTKNKVKQVLNFRKLNCHVICHTSKDTTNVQRIYTNMETNGVDIYDSWPEITLFTVPCS